MGEHAEASDNFDFSGCLDLARGLWRFAEQFVTTDSSRRRAGHAVMSTWKGRYAQDAQTSMRSASTTATNAESGLRQEANTLANRWADEWLREANIRYQNAVHQAESHKHWWQKAWDGVFGDDTYKDHPLPKRPEVPSSPAFQPTATLPDYHF